MKLDRIISNPARLNEKPWSVISASNYTADSRKSLKPSLGLAMLSN
jgi:hypothetical protein